MIVVIVYILALLLHIGKKMGKVYLFCGKRWCLRMSAKSLNADLGNWVACMCE